MTSKFWNTQNIIITAVALLSVPTGSGAALFLLKRANAEEKVAKAPEPIVSKPEPRKSAEIVPVRLGPPKPSNVGPQNPSKLIKSEEAWKTLPAVTIDKSSSTPTSTPTSPAKSVATTIPAAVAKTIPAAIAKSIPAVATKTIPEAPAKTTPISSENSSQETDQLLRRVGSATSESVLSDDASQVRSAIKSAEVVTRLFTVSFSPGQNALNDSDENYLLSALQNNTVFREHRNNPNATVAVLGYASQDGDPRNNHFAFSRAESAAKTIQDNESKLDFDGPVKTWCIGETDLIGKEATSNAGRNNRAAEVWLIVDNDRMLPQVSSDNIAQPAPAKASPKKASTKTYRKKTTSRPAKRTTTTKSYSSPKRSTYQKFGCKSGGCRK